MMIVNYAKEHLPRKPVAFGRSGNQGGRESEGIFFWRIKIMQKITSPLDPRDQINAIRDMRAK